MVTVGAAVRTSGCDPRISSTDAEHSVRNRVGNEHKARRPGRSFSGVGGEIDCSARNTGIASGDLVAVPAAASAATAAASAATATATVDRLEQRAATEATVSASGNVVRNESSHFAFAECAQHVD